ncbi:hypothetical protein V1520DRAFT_368376 [Lipomyces starkeyi]|uniref:Uncharacterized protein n=1 Tax=Lipomyces starkeyi NRRL Y-11557 TaxID=675824 RepID=A0A1E3QH33_LIPST|nr:hypothetical protein LIPSTDRAFT_131800 [Lipomyces starkeyi NRRL Y-11557]
MTGKLEIADDGPKVTESNQPHSNTFAQLDQSQDSQYNQHRKKKRKIKHKNKQQKQDTNDKSSRRPSHYFSDFVKQKLDEKEIVPSILLAANEDDLSEEIKDATQHMASQHMTQNLPEDEEDYKDQSQTPDWTDSTADSQRHCEVTDEDDNVHEWVSDDHNICDAQWEERESNAEFEMIEELDRLDRGLDVQEEEVLWAFMNSGSRIQTTSRTAI